MSYPTQK